MPEKPSKLLPAVYGGLIMGAISGLPVLHLLNCLCCAGILLGGFLGVMFYKNEFAPNMPPLTSSDCIQVGAIAGLFGALFGTILHLLVLATVGNVSNEMVLDIMRNLNLPGDILDRVEQSIQQSDQMSSFAIGMTLVSSLIIDPLFGLLGGLIGFSVFKPKQSPMNMPPSPPPSSVQ
jgi:hypothetical protein